MKWKKSYIVTTVLLIAICLVTLVGSSYALFTKTLTGTKKVSVQTGTLKVDFTEGNRINLSNVAPMSDSDGMNTTPYTFTITNSGTMNAYYTVRNEEDSSNTLNNKYIKYRLMSDNYDSGIKTLDTMGNGYYMLSSESSLSVGQSVTYKLYLWLSSEADNDAQNKTYQSKIVVQSTTNSISETVATTLLNNGVGDNGSIDASDPEQTFITGTNPNNYIWYSGKLWRAVSIDLSDNTVKLVTQWNISAVSYNEEGNANFKGSIIEQWLNDTSVDGFLGNLREPEKFIKTDSVWNATATTETSKPIKTTMVTDPVGLLNLYEYSKCSENATQETNYLTNGLWWWLLTPKSDSTVNYIKNTGIITAGLTRPAGARPSVNLKPNIKIVSGNGTSDNPYRLEGDNDTPTGVLLSARYSGEYISFGTGKNNLYRIVSHEGGTGTKITSSAPLINTTGSWLYTFFDTSSSKFSKDTTIGKFLNETYLQNETYLTTEQLEMINNNSTWYVGSLLFGENYKLIKYSNVYDNTINSNNIIKLKVGLLRSGELMASQFASHSDSADYWLLTRYDDNEANNIGNCGDVWKNNPSKSIPVKPAMNLKSNVVITGGDGTKSNPFTIKLNN